MRIILCVGAGAAASRGMTTLLRVTGFRRHYMRCRVGGALRTLTQHRTHRRVARAPAYARSVARTRHIVRAAARHLLSYNVCQHRAAWRDFLLDNQCSSSCCHARRARFISRIDVEQTTPRVRNSRWPLAAYLARAHDITRGAPPVSRAKTARTAGARRLWCCRHQRRAHRASAPIMARAVVIRAAAAHINAARRAAKTSSAYRRVAYLLIWRISSWLLTRMGQRRAPPGAPRGARALARR